MSQSKEAATAIPQGMARVVVYRPGIFGTAIQPAVSIDNVEKGKCQPKGAFSADVTAGNHMVSATTEVRRETMVTVQPGQTAYVRCGIGMGLLVGQPRLEVVPEATGKSESAPLPFTGKF